MFYSHFLSLPLFAALGSQIITTAMNWGICFQWCWLLLNICMVYFGVRGIYSLTPLTSSLTTTLTMTVRKFTSLIISVFYFGNPFTQRHWIGSAVVFFGTLFYVFASQKDAAPAPPATATELEADETKKSR
jgi:UDP-xylose/UDP-N-acetylglucosamine transporter B4